MRRSENTEQAYVKYLIKCRKEGTQPFTDQEPIMDFGDWKLIKNKFPYDKLYRKHDLLIPSVRVKQFQDIPTLSQKRYHAILSQLEPYYDLYFVNMPSQRSVTTHWHAHLAKWYG